MGKSGAESRDAYPAFKLHFRWIARYRPAFKSGQHSSTLAQVNRKNPAFPTVRLAARGLDRFAGSVAEVIDGSRL